MLCPKCFQEEFGFDPDMGDDLIFESGQCDKCGTTAGLVFKEEN